MTPHGYLGTETTLRCPMAALRLVPTEGCVSQWSAALHPTH